LQLSDFYPFFYSSLVSQYPVFSSKKEDLASLRGARNFYSFFSLPEMFWAPYLEFFPIPFQHFHLPFSSTFFRLKVSPRICHGKGLCISFFPFSPFSPIYEAPLAHLGCSFPFFAMITVAWRAEVPFLFS